FLEVPHFPHYASPFTVIFLILCVESFRYLRPAAPLLACLVLAWMVARDTDKIVRQTTPDRYQANVVKKESLERDLAQKSPGKPGSRGPRTRRGKARLQLSCS